VADYISLLCYNKQLLGTEMYFGLLRSASVIGYICGLTEFWLLHFIISRRHWNCFSSYRL